MTVPSGCGIGRPAGGLLIDGAAVLTVDDSFTIHDPGWVHVVDDRVAALGSGPAPDGLRLAVGRVIDGTGFALMPGMTNAHTHLFQTFFRGQADDKPLLDWLRECIWPGAVHLDRESAGLAATVGLIENLRSGATTVVDHQYVHVDESIDDAVCEAADRLGVRFLLARGWADRNYEPRLTETAETVLQRTVRVRERWHGRDDNRVRVELAPLIPWGCSDDAMRSTVASARSWGAGTHIHCAETRTEVEMSIDERGMRHVEWLDSLGLGSDFRLAHSVWLDDAELDLVAQRGAVVVSCPVSNMYLASGVPRIPEMLERGIRVGLGSDGSGSNNRQDLFEVLKTTVLLAKVDRLDAMALQPEQALTMACRGGAAATGLSAQTGCIAAGRKADLVMVDLRSVFVAPVHRVASALVFCASPAQVRHVIVDGRVLIDDACVVGIDERAALAAAEAAAAELFSRAGIASRLTR